VGAVARYVRVAEALGDEIRGLSPNSLLPGEQQLARRFGVSRVTVRLALDLLERSGLVWRQRGRGTIVNPPKITRRLSPLRRFEDDLREQGVKFETRVLAWEPCAKPPEPFREFLRLPSRASAGLLSMLRVVDDRVVCHDCRYFPPAVAASFDPVLVHARTVSEIVEEIAGMRVATVDWESEVVPASSEAAAVLGLKPGTLVVSNTFTYYLPNGAPAEAGRVPYRIDRCKFKFADRIREPVSSRREASAPRGKDMPR